jgi:hypothetical protein
MKNMHLSWYAAGQCVDANPGTCICPKSTACDANLGMHSWVHAPVSMHIVVFTISRHAFEG